MRFTFHHLLSFTIITIPVEQKKFEFSRANKRKFLEKIKHQSEAL